MVASTAVGVDDVDGGGDDNNNYPALHRFIQKLFGLASSNVKTKEVVLLLLLEPVMRLQQSQQMQYDERAIGIITNAAKVASNTR